MAIKSRYRALVVDDDRKVLITIAGVLSADMEVITATTADAALELLAAEQFHVVCSDFKMPGMNGIELLRKVAALRYPVGCLILTGADEFFDIEEGSEHYVLRKPVNPERLLALMLQLASNAEMKRSTSSGGGAASTRRPVAGPPESGVIGAPASSKRSVRSR